MDFHVNNFPGIIGIQLGERGSQKSDPKSSQILTQVTETCVYIYNYIIL